MQHVCLACRVSLLQSHCPCLCLIADLCLTSRWKVTGHVHIVSSFSSFIAADEFFSQPSTLSFSLCPSACRTASFIASLSLSPPPPPSPLSSLRPQCLPVTPPLQFPSCLRGYQSHQELHQQPYTSHGSSAPITALLTNAQLINTAQRLFLL